MDSKRVVIVGCSGTGALAAIMLKKLDPDYRVTIVREPNEEGLLTRCACPYICCGEVLVNPSYKDDNIFTSRGIELVNAKAEAVDRQKKSVITADGQMFPYGKLVLATGAQPVRPPIKGVDLPGVFTLRTSGDAYSILNWMNRNRVDDAALIGGGAIGIEIAYLTAKKGIRLALIEMLDHVLQKALDPDMSKQVEDYMAGKGIAMYLGHQVVEIEGKDKSEKVKLASGTEINADMVIISAGAKPRTELAMGASLEIGELGLKVNKYLQTSDPDIYAAGDVIEYPSFITGKSILGQLRPNAVIGGRIIARNILGHQVEYPPFVNGFATKFFEKSIAGTGITETEAESEGIPVHSILQTADSQHSMMINRKQYVVKLIFRKDNGKIIGGQIVSDSDQPIKNIDAITVAIRSNWTASQLATLRCAGQPELSPDPGREPIALAAVEAEMALAKLRN